MMKNYLVLSFALFSFFAANAQVSLGIRGSINLSRVHRTPTPDYDLKEGIRFGGLVGGVADINLKSNFHLRPEIRFSSKGGKTSIQNTPGSYVKSISHQEKIHYLELPVFLAYHFKIGAGEIVANAGPYLGLALGGKHSGEDHTKEGVRTNAGKFKFRNKISSQEYWDLSLYHRIRLAKRMDYGLAAGLGYKLKRFMINGTYSFGIPTIYTKIENEQGPVTPRYKYRYKVFQLSLAYFLKHS